VSYTSYTFLTFLEKSLKYKLEDKKICIKREDNMNHSFNVELAKKYGIEEAILIENIAFWIKKNMTNNKNYINGEYWVYNSSKSFNELFPYMNCKKIQRALLKLEKLNVIKSDNFNKLPYDKTKWYAIVDPQVKKIFELNVSDDFISKDNMSNGTDHFVQRNNPNCPMDRSNLSNGRDDFVQPIPVINTIIKTDIKTTTTNSHKSKLDRPKDIQNSSGGSLRAIKQKLLDANLEILTCKNIMKIINDKNITLERLTKVLDFSAKNNKSPGFIVAALKNDYTLDPSPRESMSIERSKKIDEDIRRDREIREKQIREKDEYLREKEHLDNYFNGLSKEKQGKIMEEANKIAKKEYGFIWEVMGRTKVKYDILKGLKG